MKKKLTVILILILSSMMLFASSFDKESAKQQALADAGLKKGDVKWLHASVERDDGWKFYEVSFTHAEYEYEYEFTENGEMLSKSYELRKRPKQDKNATIMDTSKAEEIVRKITGRNDIRLHRDIDDGITTYDAEVFTDNAIYDIEFDAVSGLILSISIEYRLN